jgi:hypothetical protein
MADPGTDTFGQTINKIVQQSIDNYYNPYQRFEWVDSLVENQWWMSRNLMTVYGTAFEQQFSQEQLKVLSKWESINFYSLNIHGIRELMTEVTKRIHSPGFEAVSSFFHHFLGEENEHMWFFATFCLKYGSKIYPDMKMVFSKDTYEPDIESFLVFARILIFEEIVDFFNIRMGRDDTLHPLIQQINNVHHQDESRHVMFGREIVKHLYYQIREKYVQERLQELENYLKRYIIMSVESLYNPAVYKDAGIPEPYKLRAALLKDPARKSVHQQFLNRIVHFLTKNNIISEDFIQ